jgi:DNA replication and repair protein RecF
MVSPNDQQLITGGSDLRRKFVDGVISQTDHAYLEHLVAYSKALEQRNRLLKQMWDDRQWDEAMVGVWDAQLVTHGEFIYNSRKRFIEDFTPLFEEYYHWIVGVQEPGTLVYSRDERPLQLQLEASRQADRYSQYTNVGPHKDDLLLQLTADFPLKKFGSQEQQKSFALALKLAQFQYLLNHSGEKPILLLDDIFDKLDSQRVEQIVRLVASQQFGQIFITDTNREHIDQILKHGDFDYKLYEVKDGEINV